MKTLLFSLSFLIGVSATAQKRVLLKPKQICWTAGWIDFTPKSTNYQDTTFDVEYALFSVDSVCIENRIIKLPLSYIGLFAHGADQTIIGQLLWQRGQLEMREEE